MKDAERRLLITRLLLVTFLGFTLSLAKAYMNAKRDMEAEEVVRDVELFIKASRLQELILPEHTTIIKELERSWSNACYRGAMFTEVKIAEWIRQSSIDILSP